MPLFQYECRACKLEEERIAGIDDCCLVCTECGGVMDRCCSHQEAFAGYQTSDLEKAG